MRHLGVLVIHAKTRYRKPPNDCTNAVLDSSFAYDIIKPM